MEYDSVLDQQSISGKNVSLILCVWKPGYMKSGHIYIYQCNTLSANPFWHVHIIDNALLLYLLLCSNQKIIMHRCDHKSYLSYYKTH